MSDHKRTGTSSAAGRLLKCRYHSPVGDLLIISDDSSLKVLAFAGSKSRLPAGMAKIPTGENRPIASCCAYLDYYFGKGSRKGKNALLHQSVRFDKKSLVLFLTAGDLTLAIDCSACTAMEAQVYAMLLTIPFGSTISYGDLARRSGFKGAARFVGTTMAKNMVPIIIPCHRVIRSDGSMGNYSGGIHIKKFLLDLERN